MCPTRRIKSFLFGMAVGVSIGLVSVCLFAVDDPTITPRDVLSSYEVFNVNVPKQQTGVVRNLHSKKQFTDHYSSARDMSSKIRVLCWLYFRNSDKFDLKMKATFNTWGRKCTTFLVFVDKHNHSLPAIGFDKVKKTVSMSESKIISAYRYIYKHHFHDADWFFSAESIPFVIMENLRHFLSDKNSDVPIYFGHKMRVTKHIPGFLYADRCAGIVLSRAGLRHLGTRGYSVEVCHNYEHKLGIQFSQCMLHSGVSLGDARDQEGRSRFLLFSVGHTIMADENITFEYRADAEVSGRKGEDKLSHSPISIGRNGVYGNVGSNFVINDLIKVGS